MAFSSVAANYQDQVGLLDVADRPGIAAIANRAKEAGGRGGLAITRAVVHIIRANDRARQFLHQVAFFVRTLRRRDKSQRIGARSRFDFSETPRYEIERLIPGGFAELSVFANQRGSQAIFAVHKSPAEFAFDAR